MSAFLYIDDTKKMRDRNKFGSTFDKTQTYDITFVWKSLKYA